MLPLRELNVLANIKAELIQRESDRFLERCLEFAYYAPNDPPNELEGIHKEPDRHTPERTMRGAKAIPQGWQKMCRARNNAH